ncbi:MAG: hypothetical protein R3C40_11485 [Parvularculaceae bacterium]
MTDEMQTRLATERQERAERILDLALVLVEERLDCIDPKEKKDNMSFDRAARTALSFIRVALDADALAARKRKEHAADDKGANVRLPDADEIEKLERRLRDGMARSAHGRECGGAGPSAVAARSVSRPDPRGEG